MGINFSESRWKEIKDTYDAWWRGELKRPLIQFVVGGRDPGRPEPATPSYDFTAFYDSSVSADEIVDRWDYNLSSHRFLGDAFPCAFANFGPGVGAVFAGAILETSQESWTCWFHPAEEKSITELKLEFDSNNPWFHRISDIYRAALDRWEGSVQLAMTDIGGNLDILSSFRPGEQLLFDLYDEPEAVKARTWEAHELWWRTFSEFNAILQPVNPGYTAWAQIFSSTPYYMLQCDFCYMIGPDMFDEFVKPELQACCQKLDHAFYHLDGPGQLPHLDSLLSITELKGVQWIPGAGVPDFKHWPEVYRKIRDAGKLIQLYGTPDVLDAVVEQLGATEGIILIGWPTDEMSAEQCLRKYGAPIYD